MNTLPNYMLERPEAPSARLGALRPAAQLER